MPVMLALFGRSAEDHAGRDRRVGELASPREVPDEKDAEDEERPNHRVDQFDGFELHAPSSAASASSDLAARSTGTFGSLSPVPGPYSPGRATWLAIRELAMIVPIERWSVVGGQMVAIHAARFGVVPPRPTTDGDIVVDVRAYGRGAMREIADALLVLGFAVEMSPEGVTRFTRATAKVDLLAPEGVGPT